MSTNIYKKEIENLECRGLCQLNICGTMDIWETVCNKCNGTKEEQELIDKSFNDRDVKFEIMQKYNFTREEKETLYLDWY